MDYWIQLSNESKLLCEKMERASVYDFAEKNNINIDAKGSLSSIAKKILLNSGYSSLVSAVGDKLCSIKTIRLDRYGRLGESISLPTLDYCELSSEKWEDSKLREYFFATTYLFIVFQEKGKELYLEKIKPWKMPHEVIDDGVKVVWEKMHTCLNEGTIVKYISENERFFSHFPASADSPYIHVRPHARDKYDTLPLPVPDKLTGMQEYPKHSFWINRNYVTKIIGE